MVVDNPSIIPTHEDRLCGGALYQGKHFSAGEIRRGSDEALPGAPRSELTDELPQPGRIEITFDMPLAEVVFDFYDKLKSITQGYGSFDYEIIDYRESNLVKLDILVNGEKVDALSMIVHRDRARERAVRVCDKLRDEIPRHLFKIAIQGAIGGKIISRSTVSPYRKDVTAKCYGGDISRKRKLLEKQKKGKKRMSMVGNVEIPQSAFMAALKTDEE